jgi:hypothetical protein
MKFKSLEDAEKIRPGCPVCGKLFNWLDVIEVPISFKIDNGVCTPNKKFAAYQFMFKCESKRKIEERYTYKISYNVRFNLNSFRITSVNLVHERLWARMQKPNCILRIDTNFKQNSIVRMVDWNDSYGEGVSLILPPLKEIDITKLLEKIVKVAALK